MNSNLIIFPNKGITREEWHIRRLNGLGASETGTVLGLNKWKCALELFYEKLDASPRIDTRSFFALNGLEQENTLAKYHRYWDGSAESVVKNMSDKKTIRTSHKINGSVQNPNYPWLFASPDRIINKHKGRGEGVLELKTMNSFEARKWTSTVPPNYLIQIHTQMVVCMVDYGELATLTDGMFDVIPFERRKELEDQIIERTYKFWQSVLQGRKILTQKYEAIRNHNMKLAAELQAELELLEPGPDGSEAYEQFLKDKYKQPLAQIGLIKGTPDDLATAKELQALKKQQKDLETQTREKENILKRRIAENRAIDLGADGKITWDGPEGKARTLRLQLK